jgi:hypothetical protein
MTTNPLDLLDIFRNKIDTKALTSTRLISLATRSGAVPRSVLEAIRMGIWDFEPLEVAFTRFAASDAMPGTEEKLGILAERARRGLPLWHMQDRDDVESPPPPSLLRRKPH